MQCRQLRHRVLRQCVQLARLPFAAPKRWVDCRPIQWCHFSSSAVPAVLLPPLVFSGLLITLWAWKCLMLVVFQNKIIYMPGLPPYARKEKISDYFKQCHGVKWRQVEVRAADGVQIRLCIADTECHIELQDLSSTVYVLYFQGNAGSIPMRLPLLSPIVKSLTKLEDGKNVGKHHIRYTFCLVSYRGYWTSGNRRPTERGLAKDAAAALSWVQADASNRAKGDSTVREGRIPVVLWGQSLGCGVATNCAAEQFPSEHLDLRTLILETPFVNVRDMLTALYPQKFLPYRYLYPFLWNHLDSSDALCRLATRLPLPKHQRPKVLVLQADKDELVPEEHGKILEKRCLDVGLPVERKLIRNSLHTGVMLKADGRVAVVEALQSAFISPD